MGADEARSIAAYFIRGALAKAREGKYGRSWVLVVKARSAVVEMRDPTATALLKEVHGTFHTKDHKRIRSTLAGLAEYLA
jgi:hypothetical protein